MQSEKKTNTGYACSTCGASVLVVNEKLVRSCTHMTTVHATLSAVVSQHGGISTGAAPRG